LKSLNLSDTHKVKQLLVEEFIHGINESSTRTLEDNKTMEQIINKIREIYSWDGRKSIQLMAAQKCPNMMLYICKLIDYDIDIHVKYFFCHQVCQGLWPS